MSRVVYKWAGSSNPYIKEGTAWFPHRNDGIQFENVTAKDAANISKLIDAAYCQGFDHAVERAMDAVSTVGDSDLMLKARGGA